jgi:hypothetical protein
MIPINLEPLPGGPSTHWKTPPSAHTHFGHSLPGLDEIKRLYS